MKKLVLTAFALLAANSIFAVETATEAAARPFPLDRVRVTGGIFKEKQELDRKYLLEYMDLARTDKLLAEFRRVAGLPAKAVRYEGRWEGGGINGHILGHYLTALSACYAATGDERAKTRADYIVDELAACQDANGDGYVMTIPQSDVWDKVKSGDFRVGGFHICDWWVPNYTLHKVFAGLRDAYRWTGNAKALEVERKLGDWYIGVVKDLDDDKLQKLLKSEWGGLNETFADLAADTGDMKYLKCAIEKFDHREIFDPLRDGEDRMDGKHANTQLPKITGLAAIYDMTGDERERKAVETYWNATVNHRSYANGGHSDNEHFFPAKDFPKHLGARTCETCNINNMHRLSSHLFAWHPDSAIADFVELSLINQLLAQIGEKEGEFGYFLSTKPVATKVFSQPEGAWWCCCGTGMENPMRYGEQAYFHDDDGLWVNLYMSSTLDWREKGVTLVQTTDFPESGRVSIKVLCETPVHFALRLRKPAWCESFKIETSDFGLQTQARSDASGYIVIDREWNDGDSLRLELPMTDRKVALPRSDGRYVAFLHGPVVMVGITPPQANKADPAKMRWEDHLAAPAGTNERAMTLVDGKFQPHDVAMMPLYKAYEEHYTMYFPVMSGEEWEEKKELLEREAAEAAALAERTTDEIEPGFQQSEVNHDYAGVGDNAGYWHEETGRDAKGPGSYFEYRVAVDPAKPMELAVKYWVRDLDRDFDIVVDGVVIASEPRFSCDFFKSPAENQGRFATIVYPVPESLTRGKDKVALRFAANSRTGAKGIVGAVFGIALRTKDETE